MNNAAWRPDLLNNALQAGHNKIEHTVILAVLGTVVLWISARISIPFYPVPMTLQTLAVMLIGALLGWRLGTATVLLYLAEGAAGLPVFAGTPERGLGLAYMAGPTGGYLLGFVLAAMLVGWLAERGWTRSIGRCILTMCAANLALFVPGVLWLGVLFGWSPQLLDLGVTPFIPGAILKIGLAVMCLQALWNFSAKRHSH